MGSPIEINDTLQLTIEQGFPESILNLEKHRRNPIKSEDLKGMEFSFHKKWDARIFHLDPVRVYLVQNIDNKWLFWGHALIQRQEIRKKDPGANWKPGDWETNGSFIITKIYDPSYQELVTKSESPSGRSYF
ncbi:MAG: hypothetical protein K2X27_07635 [Candidatus Obscuribacterales bacterium]|nr:hypothetical protein [Candidatus Obscuribacterales bacterium]